MRGALVLVVGPSGVGKDTVIRIARERLEADPAYLFPRRLVTRPPSPDEDNEQIAARTFDLLEAKGRFALSWRAHGLGYALPADAVALTASGRVVVCNASRAIVEEARSRFPHVSVVEITAPPDVLAGRLAARGRPQDGDLTARLARDPTVVPDLTIANVGPPEGAADRFVRHLRSLRPLGVDA